MFIHQRSHEKSWEEANLSCILLSADKFKTNLWQHMQYIVDLPPAMWKNKDISDMSERTETPTIKQIDSRIESNRTIIM